MGEPKETLPFTIYNAPWGSYGKCPGLNNPKLKVKWYRLIDLSTDHLINILITETHIGQSYRNFIRDILKQRRVIQ